MDESGDLSFARKASNYYIIACVEVFDYLELARATKKTRKTLSKKKKNIPELKFSESEDKIRRRFLDKILKTDAMFSTIVLRKKTVYNHLRERREKLHNYLAGFLAESLTYEYGDEPEFSIIVDKFMNYTQIEEFNWYLRAKMSWLTTSPKIEIRHEDSQLYPGLQAADFVAGSVFQYYERGITNYYNKIQPKLRTELRKWF